MGNCAVICVEQDHPQLKAINQLWTTAQQDYLLASPYQILINHPELDMSVRSMYTYIDKGLFTARNVDLKRQAKFKPRKCHKTQIKDREVFTNRTYADFCSLELNSYVQMDTVKSSRDSQKTLLTMIFTEEKTVSCISLLLGSQIQSHGRLRYFQKQM